jgi:hypothetical protein
MSVNEQNYLSSEIVCKVLSLTTHIFFIFRTDGGFMTATLAASLGAAQNLYVTST